MVVLAFIILTGSRALSEFDLSVCLLEMACFCIHCFRELSTLDSREIDCMVKNIESLLHLNHIHDLI